MKKKSQSKIEYSSVLYTLGMRAAEDQPPADTFWPNQGTTNLVPVAGLKPHLAR